MDKKEQNKAVSIRISETDSENFRALTAFL